MSTSGSFTPPAAPACPYPERMTRAAALALRTAGTLVPDCVVTVTDGPVIGTAGNTSATEVTLQPVSGTEFAMEALVHTTFSANAWQGAYSIDTNAIQSLTDDFGNTVKDLDAAAPTVHGQFPWHLGSATLRDNYVEDSALAGWDVQVGTIINCDVRESSIDLTSKTAGTLNGWVTRSHTATVSGSFSAANSTSIAGTLTKAGTGAMSFLNASLNTVAVNQAAGSTGTTAINDTRLQSVSVTQPASNTGNVLYYAGNDGALSTFHQGAGNVAWAGNYGFLGFVSSAASDHNTAITRNGSVTVGAITQNSTGGHATSGDNIIGCIFESDGALTLNNTTDVARTYTKLQLETGGTCIVTDPGNAPNCVSGVKVAGQSTLNLQAGGSWILGGRLDAAAIVNTGANQITQSIVDGALTVTATAANANKLANKSFNDWS